MRSDLRPLTAVPDHVAVAVPSIQAALGRWRDQLGARQVLPEWNGGRGFRTCQFGYAGGVKLELLEPAGNDGFARAFLDRFGARVHHVTLKVPDLDEAVTTLAANGYDVVDIARFGPVWHEGFLRPSQVGGLIVQLAFSGHSDDEIRAVNGFRPEPPPQDAAVLVGPVLGHPDLDAAARLWTALGGEVERDGDAALEVRWAGAPLRVRVQRAAVAAPLGLRFTGASPLPHDDTSGAAVLR